MASETEILRAALFLAQMRSEVGESLGPLVEFAKIIVPALGAYLLSRMQARKEQRAAQVTIEEATRQQLAAKEDRLAASWESMTVQARELLSRAYQDAAEAAAARRSAEARAATLESELATLRMRHSAALEELEALRTKGRRRRAEAD